MATKVGSKTRRIDAYQLKISLVGSQPLIWRRILVKPKTPLAQLHSIIQIAMGWEDYHLHQFQVRDERYGIPDPDFPEPNVTNERGVTLFSLVEDGCRKLTYEYDFGDGWEHEIKVEKLLSGLDNFKGPLCIDGERACPPEDSGGLYGFYDKLEALADSSHEEHEDVRDWMGDFDPTRFVPLEINRQLAGRFRTGRKSSVHS